ncbi:MAG: ROK family protein [Candidatus Puniceispirillaceae bacterium]
MRLGIDLGGTKIEAAIIDDSGSFVCRERVATPTDFHDIIRAIKELTEQVSATHNYDGPVGICTPGSISNATGLLQGSNSQSLNGRDVRHDLQAALNRPVRIANDANCFALSEAIDGAGKGYSSVFGVIIGTGCGGGIVVDQKIVGGANGIAGEWGHVPLPWPVDHEFEGHECWCGRTGCLETYISGTGLELDYFRITNEKADAKTILAKAEAGDIVAESIMQVLEDRIGRGLAMIINILDPDVIILGGGLSNIDRLYVNIPRKWPGYVFSNAIENKLLKPVYGDSSGIRGAAHLFHDEA